MPTFDYAAIFLALKFEPHQYLNYKSLNDQLGLFYKWLAYSDGSRLLLQGLTRSN